MRSFKTEGIIIRRINYKEADRIITIFSKKSGKISIKAAGVRRITSRRSPHIELLNLSNFNLYQGKGMPVLTEVDSIENFSDLKKDLIKIMAAFHVCELIDGLCAENQENVEIFNLLQQTLRKISTQKSLVSVVYEFEIELLRLLGFYTKTTALKVNTKAVIEEILERKLKTRQILPQFYS